MTQLADAFVRIVGDTKDITKVLQNDIPAEAAKSGDKSGKVWGAKMGMAVRGTVGALVGGAFAIALKGAAELDTTMAKLRADTGMTGEEAKAAQTSLAGMYKTNLQGFAAIGEAMAAVHNDLGLVGKEADKATKAFLRFSTATGQEAVAAVQSFDDILDSWGMTAKDAQGIMDKLVVSHHKYGGTIADNQKTLAALAPSMRAANFEIDDAIALLNLFGAKGIDANTASAAFSKSLTKVKSPEELQFLIDDISATEDPFLRAQKAAELFGARAGAKLGNALAGANLDDYKVSIQEAAGASERAAKDIESSWGAKFQLLMKNVGGTLAELGSSFGPLLMVGTLVGPKMATSIGAGLGGLGGILSKRILKAGPIAAVAGTRVGMMAGTAMGAAMGVAAAAAIGVGIALAFKAIVLDPALNKQTEQIGTDLGNQVAKGTTESLMVAQDALKDGIAKIKALPFGEFLYGDQIAALEADLDAATTEVARRSAEIGAAIPTGLAAGVESTKPVWSGKVEDIVTFFGTSMAGVKAAAKVAGAEGMMALAAGITSARAAPLSAFDQLKTMLKTAMTPQAEQLRLHGQLLSKTLAAGLKSGDPAVRAQAVATAKVIADRLGELAAQGGKAGRKSMEALEQGIKSKNAVIAEASRIAKENVLKNLQATKGPAGTAGTKAGAAFVNGFAGKIEDDLTGVGLKYAVKFPGKEGYAEGSWKIPTDQTARIHAGEMIIPARQSAAIRAGQASVTASGMSSAVQGATTNIVVNNPTPEPASTSVSREMRKLAYMGAVS